MRSCAAAMLVIAAAVAHTGAAAAPLRAGAARVSITPDPAAVSFTLGGYADAVRLRERARGVTDPCLARALVFDDGRARCAIVSLDLCFVPGSVKAAVAARIGGLRIPAGSLLLCATHTHSGPDPLLMHAANVGENGALPDHSPALLAWTADRIAQALREACAALRPATAGVGQRAGIGLNRNRRGDGLTDDTLSAVRIDGRDGAPIAAVFAYAAHPTFHGPDMLEVSGDWPGAFQQAMERERPGMVALFVNGAEGDAATRGATGDTPGQRVASYAALLARPAAETLRSVRTSASAPVAAWCRQVRLPPASPHALFQLAALQFGARPPEAHRLVERLMPAATEVSFLRVAGLTLVGVPGEPTAGVGALLRAQARALGTGPVAVVALTNDWHGYFLTRAQYRAGKYEASMSFHGESGGEALARGVRAGLRQHQPRRR